MINGEGGTRAPGDTEGMNSIMQFRVVLPLKSEDKSTIPDHLLPYHHTDPKLASKEITLHLDGTIDSYGRVMHLLNDRMIVMHFKEHAGDYVWHCHILEHEDNDMMRPLKVIENK